MRSCETFNTTFFFPHSSACIGPLVLRLIFPHINQTNRDNYKSFELLTMSYVFSNYKLIAREFANFLLKQLSIGYRCDISNATFRNVMLIKQYKNN